MINQLKLHKDIYKKNKIYQACMDYKKIADIQIQETDNYFICIFLKYSLDIELIKKEFANYLIVLNIKEKRNL